MHWVTLFSFVFFTALVGVITWILTRRDDHASASGYFLAGRTLTFPFIAGSLLLTNLSTEQLVGLNGAAFTDGLAVMVWEVFAVVALVAMALFFLPRFLKSGVTTVPEFLELRFDHQTQVFTNLVFLIAYVTILLPIILYTGATGLAGILDIQALIGIESETMCLWIVVWLVGIVGSLYALFGGLRTVAVSDTINGVGLLVGGFLITGFSLKALGQGEGMTAGLEALRNLPEKYSNSIGGPETSVPFETVFTGIILLHLFYWTTNQQIIQRTLGAANLAEGQKGVLLTGFLKLLGPLYLVLPGIVAYAMFTGQEIKADHAYGELVSAVLPAPLAGFFAAAMVGAILSSFNSVLNSSCTLFSLGIYKPIMNPGASDAQIVQSGKVFGWIVAIASMLIAPLLAKTTSIFGYLQQMNGIYMIPMFAVVVVGMLNRRVTALAAKLGLATGLIAISLGYFVPPFTRIVSGIHNFHFLGLVFVSLIILMLLISAWKPRETPWVQHEANAVDMTPWRYTKPVGFTLLAVVAVLYVLFADLSVLDTQTQ
ncbi:MAG: sodium:solute symporter [Candidatus Hydrogenedentota bacterium]